MTTTKADAIQEPRLPKLAVACVTRGRPAMFAKALNSLVSLDLPDEAEVVFCFVENAEKLSVEAEVETFRALLPSADVQFCCEPRLGIPRGRWRSPSWAIHQSTLACSRCCRRDRR